MTPEKQRIAIAEACGHIVTDHALFTPDRWKVWYDDVKHLIPDYLNDLNAMHEAEKVLTYPQGGKMTRWIERMTCGGYGPQLFATAAQRAEAFLRTLNRWEDEA
jgi:hypothetical protein